MGFVEDLIILLKEVNMTNVTTLTQRPVIKHDGNTSDADDDPGVTGDPESGKMILESPGNKTTLKSSAGLYDETYLVNAKFSMGDQTAQTIFQSMVDEFENVIFTENGASDRAYSDFNVVVGKDNNLSVPNVELLFTAARYGVNK